MYYSSQFINTIIESMPTAIAYTNLNDAKLINCNEICLKLFGFPDKKKVLGLSVFELNVYDNEEQREKVVNLLKEHKLINNMELPMRNSRGMRIWLAASFQLLEIDTIPVLFSVWIDITKRKVAEEALEKLNKELEIRINEQTKELRKSESGLKMAQEISRIGNWEHNFLTNEDSWSDEIYKIFGFEKGEVKPAFGTYLSTFHPDDLEFNTSIINEAKKDIKSFSILHRSYTKGGSLIYIYTESRFLFDNEGNAVAMYGITQDVTNTVEREAKLLAQNKTLSEIARMQSHQVRKPIAQILGLMNLLKTDDPADPSNSQILAKLKETAIACDKIIHDISIMNNEIERMNEQS